MRTIRLLSAMFVCSILLSLLASPASAYSLNGRRWQTPFSGTWCAGSTVTVHSSWTTYISQDVGKYNSLGSYPKPSWSYSSTCNGARIHFDASPLPVNLCGNSSTTSIGEPYILGATVVYNRYKSYGGRNGFTGDCSFDWTTLHEFGHTQGLGHSCTSGTVMWASDNGITTLTTDDRNGMRKIYDPSYTGPGPTPSCN